MANPSTQDPVPDVIVVGFGVAGACAAIEALDAGATVTILEKSSSGGGTTMLAAGHVYLGGGTHTQIANGFEDTVEDMFNYLMAVTPEPDDAKIRLYCEESLSHMAWLERHGVPFNDKFFPTKAVMQFTDETLIWSGNEKAWPFSGKAKPVPRGHKVAAENEGGVLLMQTLIARCEEKGARIETNAAVNDLVMNNGRVTGVRYKQFGNEHTLTCNKGVVLAAGGFAMNPEMLKAHCPLLATDGVIEQGNPNDDGTAINLGLKAGGVALHMDGALLTTPWYPPEQLLKGILVNKQGERFVNEDSYHSRSSIACAQQEDGAAWLICDNSFFARPDFGTAELVDAWETVEDMEAALGMPEGRLQTTLAKYNHHAAKGEDPEQHKYKDWLQPINQPPYAALDFSVGKAAYMGFTLGGLKTSIDGEVLTDQGQIIKGLFAAGACASNIAQDGSGYSSGTCIGESSFFGRRAGVKASHQPPITHLAEP